MMTSLLGFQVLLGMIQIYIPDKEVFVLALLFRRNLISMS